MDGSKDRRDRRFISRVWSTHLAAALMVVLAAPSSFAIDVVIDYSFDTNNFFGAGNPNGAAAGAQARASLDEAALFFSNILDDTFDEIMVPADFQSAVFNGNVTYSFNRVFDDPATGNGVTLPTTNVPENEFRVFAGARSLGGTTLGVGGPGGAGLASDSQGGFTQSEIDQLNATTDAFFDNVQTRGETSGFVGWGGAISFDTVTNWHFDAATDPSTGESDFFSVAIHEVAHTFGWGTSSEWDALVSGGVFVGAASTAEFGANVPIEPGHWAEGTASTVFGGGAAQETSLDPSLTSGTRKLFTDLDAAALTDIGWTVIPLPVSALACDFDGDQDCDPDDLDMMYANFGTNNATFDSNGDGMVTGLDIAAWLAQASASDNPFNASNVTFALGDLDFNGAVNSTDLGVLLNNFGDDTGLLYRAGNLDDDAAVDSTDLGLLINNFGFASASSFAVPEPSGLGMLLMLSLLGAGTFRKFA